MKNTLNLFVIMVSLAVLAMPSGCTAIYKTAFDTRDLLTIISDKKIEARILQGFIKDDTVKTLDISPFCYEGSVYLVGEYETLSERSRAVEIARKVKGVASVTAYLLPREKDGPCGLKENLKLTAEVRARLIADREVRSTNVEIKTVQCNVVLLGIVLTGREMRKAIGDAESVKGVRSVHSFLSYRD